MRVYLKSQDEIEKLHRANQAVRKTLDEAYHLGGSGGPTPPNPRSLRRRRSAFAR